MPRRFERLGVAIGAWGVFVRQGEGLLPLEAEAPEGKLPFMRELFSTWVRKERRLFLPRATSEAVTASA